MSGLCPNGHTSLTTDYCDECGAVMGAAKTPLPTPVSASAPAPPVAGPKDCPDCSTPRGGSERFCENCGYDFQTGKKSTAGSAPVTSTTPWTVTAVADRAYFDTTGEDPSTFPAVYPSRSFVLAGSTVRIGRRSASQGISPEIDLTSAPEDVAVSHLHAVLTQNASGSWVLADPGSTNGTLVNRSSVPLTPQDRVELKDGDQVHVGAWTTLTVHAPRT